MGRALPVIIAVVLLIYALITWQRCPQELMEGRLPKPIWLAIIVALPIVGPLAWILTTWVHTREVGASTDDIVIDLREQLRRAAGSTDPYGGSGEGAEGRLQDLYERLRNGGRKPPKSNPQPATPDDDPEFLWRIQREVYLEKQRRAKQQNANTDAGTQPGSKPQSHHEENPELESREDLQQGPRLEPEPRERHERNSNDDSEPRERRETDPQAENDD